ncbi:MAG: MarR family transcriptional regulator [Spirochaetes bacterium]|nr:MAG: MarR family transcriptional regulator [Spirochaetota bacterium]
MKTKKELFKDVYNQFMRINNKMNILQRIPMDYGSGESLHLSEVHTIEAIAENDGTHMAELAKVLGVTRGAIMQMAGKLEKKGFIEKFREEDNNKLVYFKLTAKGHSTYRGHQKYHQDMNNRIFSYLKNISIGEIESSSSMLDKVEEYMNRYVREKTSLSRKRPKG